MSLVPRGEWTKLQLVRCGIDTREFSRNGHPVGAHEGMHVITVGRLSARKAHAVLVEAIAALRDEGAQVRLTVVGDGEERAALETLARELELDDRVTFAGAVAHDELADVLAAADVFCLPSVAEGLPVVLMEAMAMGLPVVAARIMGIPELVEDGVTGLWWVKRMEGLAVVQDPQDARFDQMPRTALWHVPADYVSTAAEVGPLLADLARGERRATKRPIEGLLE